MRSRSDRPIEAALWRGLALAAVALVAAPALPLAGGSPAVLLAQGTGERELRGAVEERFRVLTLRDGLLLEPRQEEAAVRFIEITEEGISIDGEARDDEAVRQLLGAEDAGLVLDLAGLGPEAGAALFRSPRPGEVPRAPEAPQVPEVPEVPEAAEAPEAPEAPEPPEKFEGRRRTDPRVVVGSSLTIARDEISGDVVVVGGSLRVDGEVRGDAAVIGGPMWVDGKVMGDVAVVGGPLHLEDDAEIFGDAISVGGPVDRDPGARVHGDIGDVTTPLSWIALWPRIRHRDVDLIDLFPVHRFAELVWETLGFIVLAVLACLVLLLARRPLERIGARIAAEPWKAGLVGLVAEILFVPLLILIVFLLCVSIVGIPLLVLVPFAVLALVVGAFLGYTAVAVGLGEFLEERFGWRLGSPYVVLLVGVATIEIWSLIGHALSLGGGPLRVFALMIILFGCLVQYLVWTVGLGGALLARFGSGARGGRRREAAAAPPPGGGGGAAGPAGPESSELPGSGSPEPGEPEPR